ncbi:hypothetical protein M0R45_017387 [Rubus argutus]|uniref:FAD-binding domain-containing protein n=1 Tax=Rubus argutus TaxID=59490 RepID=A0AAW1XVZ5_RUBAR
MRFHLARAEIAGGGICGLATALALHRKGIGCTVLRRSDALRETGAAIGIQTNGWRALNHLGIGSKLRQTSVPLLGFREVSPTNISSKLNPIGDGEGRCQKRSVLLETLSNELPAGTIYFGCRIVAIEMDANTKYPVLYLNYGRVIKAKELSKANYTRGLDLYFH